MGKRALNDKPNHVHVRPGTTLSVTYPHYLDYQTTSISQIVKQPYKETEICPRTQYTPLEKTIKKGLSVLCVDSLKLISIR